MPEENVAGPQPSTSSYPLEKDAAVINELSSTLIPAANDPVSSPLLAALQSRDPLSSGSEKFVNTQSLSELEALQPHQKIIYRLRQVVAQVLRAREYDATMPIVLLTRGEFESLIRVCVRPLLRIALSHADTRSSCAITT